MTQTWLSAFFLSLNYGMWKFPSHHRTPLLFCCCCLKKKKKKAILEQKHAIHLHVVYDCLYSTIAELSSCESIIWLMGPPQIITI